MVTSEENKFESFVNKRYEELCDLCLKTQTEFDVLSEDPSFVEDAISSSSVGSKERFDVLRKSNLLSRVLLQTLFTRLESLENTTRSEETK